MTEARATILIVDDDISVTWTFARMLRMEGYAVLTAFDAETGLRETAAHQPDAILLDLRMPIMDGVKFLRQLRGREHDRLTPVAIVTGDYFIDDNVTGEIARLGAVIHFKPLWLEDVLGLTERLLRN